MTKSSLFPAPAGALARDLPRCLYASTAPAAIPTPPLAADARTRIAVVGAGYTGLSAALHLAERGLEVVLLEAHEPGWGAAGRNGGQVNAGLKHEPDTVLGELGPTAGGRLLGLAGGAPDYLFGLIDRLGIACEAERGGTLRAAYNDSQSVALERSVAAWRSLGVAMRPLDAAAMRAATGSARYSAGVLDPRGGAVNPLSLARGLAAAAVRAGARLYGSTPARRLARAGSGWTIATAGGTVRADSVLLATDGYTMTCGRGCAPASCRCTARSSPPRRCRRRSARPSCQPAPSSTRPAPSPPTTGATPRGAC